MPTWIGKLTLLAVVIGAISANALNMYSGSISFMTLGLRLPTNGARAAVALVLGVIGLIVAFPGIKNAGSNYENFLLIISYWIGPWLGVVFVDWVLRRGTSITPIIEDRTYLNWAGPIAMFVATVVSIWLFSNQTKYQGLIVKHHPAVGDLTFEVGFLIAAVLYLRPVHGDQAGAGSGRDRDRGRSCTRSMTRRHSIRRAGWRWRWTRPGPGWPRAASRSGPPCSGRTGRCSAAGTTAGCRTTIRPCTARRRRSATPAGNRPTGARRW